LSQAIARVMPAGIDIAVRPGETLFAAAYRAGITWPTICQGQGRCTRCRVTVLANGDHAEPPGDQERKSLVLMHRIERTEDDAAIRLACCLRLTGDLVVAQADVISN